MKTIKMKNDEIRDFAGATSYEFPKYATQIMNLANQNSQGTRRRVVGQMTELIEEFDGRSIEDWEKWYVERYPDAIKDATEKVHLMVENFKAVIQQIDRDMVKDWIRDLVVLKTFTGLKFQEAILKKLSKDIGKTYERSSTADEAKGIDGYLDGKPVSVKPNTYKSQSLTLSESIDVSMIYYEKKKTGLTIEYNL